MILYGADLSVAYRMQNQFDAPCQESLKQAYEYSYDSDDIVVC